MRIRSGAKSFIMAAEHHEESAEVQACLGYASHRLGDERAAIQYLRRALVLDEYHPEAVAIEDIFVSKNARSAFSIGLARGIVVAACLDRKIKIYEYAPTQVKSAVTGYGRAGKEQVKKMTQLILGEILHPNISKYFVR